MDEEDDFLLVDKSIIPEHEYISPMSKTKKVSFHKRILNTMTHGMTKVCIGLLRCIWNNPTIVINGIPIIILCIYLYPILYHYYSYVPYSYGVYTACVHSYSKVKKHIGYAKKVKELYDNFYD